MKGFLSRALATVALTLCALPIAAQTTPTYSDETVISFLGSPTKMFLELDMTPEYLMSLLDENGKRYVESIEYKNISTVNYNSDKSEPSKIGVHIKSTSTTAGYIKINFNKSFNAGRIYLYGGVSGRDGTASQTGHYFKTIVNSDLRVGATSSAKDAGFSKYFSSTTYSLSQLIEQMGKPATSSVYANSSGFQLVRTKDTENLFELKSLKIELIPINEDKYIALHGIKILHNGFVENDINTGVEEIAQENGAVEYFDLYGRRLADKPTQGMFIEKRGSKVTKLLAR